MKCILRHAILMLAVLGLASLGTADEYKAGDVVFPKNPPVSLTHNDTLVVTANSEDALTVRFINSDRLWVDSRDLLRGDAPSGALEGSGWVQASDVIPRESAIVEMQQTKNRDDDKLTPDFYLQLGKMHLLSDDQRDHWKAAGMYLEAINRWPREGRLYLQRAHLWHRMGRIDSAIRDLKRLEQVDPTKKELTSDFIASWSKEDPAAAAIALATKPSQPAEAAPSPEFNPTTPPISDLAFPRDPPLQLKVGDKVVGEVNAEHFMKVLKQNGDWLWVESREIFEPETVVAHGWIAAQGVFNVDMALAKWSLAIDKPTVNPQFVFTVMGRICELTNRNEYRRKAVDYYTTAIQRWPTKPDFYRYRAASYQMLREFDKAIADLAQVARLDPDQRAFADVAIPMVRQMQHNWNSLSADERAAIELAEAPDEPEAAAEPDSTTVSSPAVPTPVGPPILPTQPQNGAEVPIKFARKTPAQLKIGAQPSAEVESHHYLIVLREDGDWLWVERHSLAIPDEAIPKGWIARGAVMDIDEQIALFRRVAQAYRRPEHYAIAAKICELRDTNKQYLVQAIACYNDAIALAPGEADYYARRGIAWGNMGDVDQAIRDVEQAAALAPNDSAIQKLLTDYREVEKLKESLAPQNTP
jgi:tetratricopeptide (TPR) repeat protein